MLGYTKKLKWHQDQDGLVITYPEGTNFATSVVFKIENLGKLMVV